MPPPTRPRAGSSAAAGTRSAGASAASRPRPISTPWSATGRSGWSGSTAMPAGPTASRCARPGSPPHPRRPTGGRIERTGRAPSGIFVDAAMALVERAVPPPLPVQRDSAFARAQDILLSNGLTTVADMGTSAEDWSTIRRAGDAGQLRVRILSYASGIDNLVAIAGTRPTPWLYDGRLRMVGVKLYLDGALGSRGAWLKQDYRDAPGQRGLPLVSDTVLKNHDEPRRDGQFPGRRARDRRRRQCRAARRDRGHVGHLYGRPALADRACPDRRSGRPSPLRAARHHRLDAAGPPDQRHAHGRGADGARPAAGRLCLAQHDRQPGAARLRLRFPGRESQPLPRPRGGDQPRGCAAAIRPAAGCRSSG